MALREHTDLKEIHNKLEDIQRELTDICNQGLYTDEEKDFNGDLILIVEELEVYKRALSYLAIKYSEILKDCKMCITNGKSSDYCYTRCNFEIEDYVLYKARKDIRQTFK